MSHTHRIAFRLSDADAITAMARLLAAFHQNGIQYTEHVEYSNPKNYPVIIEIEWNEGF